MKDIGSKLFNIRSSKINNCKKNEIPETFDSEYCLDQLDPSKRNEFIHVTTQKLERITFKMKKNNIYDGSKDGEEGNDVKDHKGEDNEKDYREAPLNVSAEEVFFTKEKRLFSSVSKEQDPKKLMVLEVNLHYLPNASHSTVFYNDTSSLTQAYARLIL